MPTLPGYTLITRPKIQHWFLQIISLTTLPVYKFSSKLLRNALATNGYGIQNEVLKISLLSSKSWIFHFFCLFWHVQKSILPVVC